MVQMEHEPYVTVVALSAESARAFFGLPDTVPAFDAGPPHDPERWKPGARRWRLLVDPARRLSVVK